MEATHTQRPGYRKQKRQGRPASAFVEIKGTRRYLGEHGSPESYQRYAAFIAEWESSGHLPITNAADLRVVELVDRYWSFAKTHYRKADGTPTSELDLLKRAAAVLIELYGDLLARDFSPLKLKAVRTRMVEKDWCRKNTNDMTQRAKRIFRWATENELVPATVYHGLKAVTGLSRGRSAARDSDPVLPVPELLITPVLDRVAPPVAAMIRLQLLTGARPGEICLMRGCDIDMKGKVWSYRPAEHKTAHHGHKRVVYLGPKAQEIVREFLKPNPQAYLFSPADADEWHRQQKHAARKTPLACGNRPGSNRKGRPAWRPGEHYTVNTYRRAIIRACDACFPPPEELSPAKGEKREEWLKRLTKEQQAEARQWRKSHRWNPHRLRHNAATRLRHEYGIDMAQTILGHRIGSSVTEIYAEKNVDAAKRIMLEGG